MATVVKSGIDVRYSHHVRVLKIRKFSDQKLR